MYGICMETYANSSLTQKQRVFTQCRQKIHACTQLCGLFSQSIQRDAQLPISAESRNKQNVQIGAKLTRKYNLKQKWNELVHDESTCGYTAYAWECIQKAVRERNVGHSHSVDRDSVLTCSCACCCNGAWEGTGSCKLMRNQKSNTRCKWEHSEDRNAIFNGIVQITTEWNTMQMCTICMETFAKFNLKRKWWSLIQCRQRFRAYMHLHVLFEWGAERDTQLQIYLEPTIKHNMQIGVKSTHKCKM